MLTIIDVLSKHAWIIPFKNKSGSETANAIAEIIRKSDRHPKNLQTDMGKKFYNADVQRLVNIHGINHYVLRNKSIGRRAVQPYAEEWYVENVYAQQKLQVDRPVTASRVELQCSKASNDRHATH